MQSYIQALGVPDPVPIRIIPDIGACGGGCGIIRRGIRCSEEDRINIVEDGCGLRSWCICAQNMLGP